MTGAEVTSARRALGERLGLGRPLRYSELGRALGLLGEKPGQSVKLWERGDGPTGPAAAALRAWLRETRRGEIPPELAETCLSPAMTGEPIGSPRIKALLSRRAIARRAMAKRRSSKEHER